MSATALHAVLDEVHRQGTPSGHSRRNFSRARDAIALEVSTPYGRLLQTIELDGKLGGKVMLRFVHPFAFLWHAFSACTPFHSLITERMHVHPCTMDVPWNLILYSDEVTPGNVLARDVTRKIQAVYFSFKELGYSALAREDVQFCITVKRSSVVKRIQGGMSAIFAALLKVFFSTATNLLVGGVALKRGAEPTVRLYAKLAMFLQDGGAHKETWHAKGNSGTRFCMLCRNIVSFSSALVDKDGTRMLKCTVTREIDLDMATDADIRGSVRRVAETHGSGITKTELKRSSKPSDSFTTKAACCWRML